MAPRKKTAEELKLTPEEKKAELEKRRKSDPLIHYKPGASATACYESNALFRCAEGPNQSGKTTQGQIECAAMARGRHPHKPWFGPVDLLVIVPSRAQASVVWGKRLLDKCKLLGEIGDFPLIPKREVAKIHNAYSPVGSYPGLIEMKNGSKIYFVLSGDPSSWKRVQGMMFDFIFRDEADGNENLGEELQWRLVRARSDPAKKWAGGILWTATPTLVNDEYEVFRDNCKKLMTNHAYYFFKPEDNPAVSMEVRESLRETMSEEAYAIRGTGEATARMTHLIFQKWDRNVHIRKEPYPIGIDDNLWIAYDPGWRHPCGILCCAVNKAEPYKIHVCAFFSYKYGTRSDHAKSMAQWLNGRICQGLVCDPAILKTESNGRSYFGLFEEELPGHGVTTRLPLMTGRNRNEDGLPLIERYFEEKLIDVDPYGQGCSEYIHQMEVYHWDPNTKSRTPYKKRDEAPDTTKYLISRFPRWNNEGTNPETGVVIRPPIVVSESLVETPEMDADARVHLERLRASIDLLDEMAEPVGLVPIGRSSYV